MRWEAPEMSSRSGNVAAAVTRDEGGQMLLAEDAEVLSRLLALRWVARTPAFALGGNVAARPRHGLV